MNHPARQTDRLCILLVIALGLLAHLLLLLDPGYFSQDELHWAAFSDVPNIASIPWASWTNVSPLQYRPLAFNLWFVISHFAFDHPMAYHGLWLSIGGLESALFFLLLRRLAVAWPVAVVAALVFLLNPYAAYTLGWVATLADLLWVGASLLLGWLLLRCEQESGSVRSAAIWALVLTTLALLAKESAIVMPVLLAIAWLLSGRRPVWRTAMIFSALPVLIYLALRLNVILFSPRLPGVYEWSIRAIPMRLLEYQLFPLLPSTFESLNALIAPMYWLILAGAGYLLVLWAIWRSHRGAAIFFLVGSAVALGPVLLLDSSSNQYGYGYFAVIIGSIAIAYRTIPAWGRLLLAPMLVLVVWHGYNTDKMIYSIGVRQAVFSPAMANAVRTAKSLPVRLRLPADDAWIYMRLAFEIPSYHGVPIQDRVRLVAVSEAADYVIASDGSLKQNEKK
jgi:hypothetical protein